MPKHKSWRVTEAMNRDLEQRKSRCPDMVV